MLADEVFRHGGVTTDFLNARRAQLAFGEPGAGDVDAVLAALWCASRGSGADACGRTPAAGGSARRPAAPGYSATGRWLIEWAAPDRYVARVAGRQYALAIARAARNRWRWKSTDRSQRLRVVESDQELQLFRGGRQVALRLERTEDALQVSAGAEEGSLLTPLPGTVVAVHVTAGQRVARGAPLVTVEAMKMEHTLTAPYDGRRDASGFRRGGTGRGGRDTGRAVAGAPARRLLARRPLGAGAARAGSVTLKRVSWPSRVASAILPPASCT